MICPKCNATIDDNTKYCPKCGAPTEQNSTESEQIQPSTKQQPTSEAAGTKTIAVNESGKSGFKEIIKKPTTWIIAVLLIICIVSITMLLSKNDQTSRNGSVSVSQSAVQNDNASQNEVTANTEKESEEKYEPTQSAKAEGYTLGDTFKVDNLEITLGKEIKFSSVDNQFSEHHKKPALGIPITVKNLGNETDSLYSYTFYGSEGTQLDSIGYYFDDSISDAGKLRPGASYSKYIYCLYDGDGHYALELGMEDVTVEFDVKK